MHELISTSKKKKKKKAQAGNERSNILKKIFASEKKATTISVAFHHKLSSFSPEHEALFHSTSYNPPHGSACPTMFQDRPNNSASGLLSSCIRLMPVAHAWVRASLLLSLSQRCQANRKLRGGGGEVVSSWILTST